MNRGELLAEKVKANKKIKENQIKLKRLNNQVEQSTYNIEIAKANVEDIELKLIEIDKRKRGKTVDNNSFKYLVSENAKTDYIRNILDVNVIVEIIEMIDGYELTEGENILHNPRGDNYVVTLKRKTITSINVKP